MSSDPLFHQTTKPQNLKSWISTRVLHQVFFTTDVFDTGNETFASLLHQGGIRPAKVLLVIDQGVLESWPHLMESIRTYEEKHCEDLQIVGTEVLPGGEEVKNDWGTFERILESISKAGLCRWSYLAVLGGGAILDAVGFAASVAHRGIRLIRLPTTTLSQADSGIGVKNGINRFSQKNFVGTFNVPFAVINDESFLTTLSDRDWRSGFSEVVKVALVKDRVFFETIFEKAESVAARDYENACVLIRRCAEFHFRHIVEGGDPFERTIARPLDFGHWSAHRLEMLTDHRLTHGEAVAIGMALDCVYSSISGTLKWEETDRILSCLESLGFRLYVNALEEDHLYDGLEEFRRHLGGKLTITLLEGIGRPFETHEISLPRVKESVGILRERATLG